MVPEYSIKEEILPEFLNYYHQHHPQNLTHQLCYIFIEVPLTMMYVCIWYYLIMYRYTYRMKIMINLDNNLYKVLWYRHKKTIYYHIYPSTYDISVQILLHRHVMVHMQYANNDMILLPYVYTFYAIFII